MSFFEKRTPSIQKILPALLLEPFFIWFEILFLFGFKPELAKKLNQKAEKAIFEWKNEKTK